ncbi:Adenylyltransferase and sulfurtransferase MOCS3, partial [Trichoplax sp. H2]
ESYFNHRRFAIVLENITYSYDDRLTVCTPCSARLEIQEQLKRMEKGLNRYEIKRYSRHLLLPQLGVIGQQKINQGKVLIVGAGGLGCPAALYLTSSGVGTIGIVDYDVVELDNLHRQILHRENKLGTPKCLSATQSMQELNSTIKCLPYQLQLDSQNAIEIISKYPILQIHCLNALRFEGQLTVYNCNNGPCYRCLFPTPPPPETVTNCSDGGVLGVVPGIIGLNQALEAIKILTGLQPAYSQRMLLFDASSGSYHVFKLRNRRPTCPLCGDNPTIHELQDYVQFCKASATDKARQIELLTPEERISVDDYKKIYDEGQNHVLLDVREEVEYNICRLPQSINIHQYLITNDLLSILNQILLLHIPLSQIDKRTDEFRKIINDAIKDDSFDKRNAYPVYVVCHHGNDSQKAIKRLQEIISDWEQNIIYKDIEGGLDYWAKIVDNEFPEY